MVSQIGILLRLYYAERHECSYVKSIQYLKPKTIPLKPILDCTLIHCVVLKLQCVINDYITDTHFLSNSNISTSSIQCLNTKESWACLCLRQREKDRSFSYVQYIDHLYNHGWEKSLKVYVPSQPVRLYCLNVSATEEWRAFLKKLMNI